MFKKARKIHLLEEQVSRLEKENADLRKEINDRDTFLKNHYMMQVVKCCTAIEEKVNHPRFKLGSLRLVPKMTSTNDLLYGASDISLDIKTDNVLAIGKDKSKKSVEADPDKVDWATCWAEIEIAALKTENALLKTKIVQFAESVKK